MEASVNACKHPTYRERYLRTKRRLGKQRGPKVAQVDLARRLAEAIWQMLTRNEIFAPRCTAPALGARRSLLRCTHGARFPSHLILPPRRR